MTVLELIKGLLDAPMDAEVRIAAPNEPFEDAASIAHVDFEFPETHQCTIVIGLGGYL